ncbi:hypothetical protein KP803_12365 [Vibrio sp. ZSDE26]|uniref:DUF2946 domain-containing protein n=1 Tax=Vibrio amylolyticus TaxID=2847292 RepID=A0A9X2BIF8_9VIBR|nr:hypothetical protein [Vibrio amylolyticus]MCK6264065.1 hypothetical protein [Vibrio amylolyticus]
MNKASRPIWLSFLLLTLMMITTFVISAQNTRVAPIKINPVGMNQSNESDPSLVGQSLSSASLLPLHSSTLINNSRSSDCPDQEHSIPSPHNAQSKHGCGSSCLFKIPTSQSGVILAVQSHSLALIEPDQNPTTQARADTLYRPPILSFPA